MRGNSVDGYLACEEVFCVCQNKGFQNSFFEEFFNDDYFP